MVQQLRIHLPTQEAWAQTLGRQDFTCQAKKAQLQSLGQQKPLQWEAHAPQLESEPHWPQLEEAQVQQQRPSTDKNRNK